MLRKTNLLVRIFRGWLGEDILLYIASYIGTYMEVYRHAKTYIYIYVEKQWECPGRPEILAERFRAISLTKTRRSLCRSRRLLLVFLFYIKHTRCGRPRTPLLFPPHHLCILLVKTISLLIFLIGCAWCNVLLYIAVV